jgi:hypothetical protein
VIIADWLQADYGEGEGQIAPVVLQRGARALPEESERKARQQSSTSPWTPRAPGGLGRRFLRHLRSRSDVSARVPVRPWQRLNLEGIANFANGIACAKNFSDARDSTADDGGLMYA